MTMDAALNLAEKAKALVCDKAADNQIKSPSLSADEKKEAAEARDKVEETLKVAMNLVDGALAKIAKVREDSTADKGMPFAVATPIALFDAHVPRGFTATADDAGGNLIKGMSNFKDSTATLEDMATNIGPVMSNFDDVLKIPSLKQFNAMLNTVPILGIKDNMIVYVSKSLADPSKPAEGINIQDQFRTFSALPADAPPLGGSEKVHLFPYDGGLCLAIGQAVWKKKTLSINTMDPDAMAAVANDFPKLYSADWEKLGNEVLPTADSLSIVPYFNLTADGKRAAYSLLALKADSTIVIYAGNELKDNGNWNPLEYAPKKDTKEKAPKFSRMTYYSANIIAYDSDNALRTLKPNFSESTYGIESTVPDDEILDMTANDVGVVVKRADGFLYQRYVEPSTKDDDGTYAFKQWISADGVTCLGVASPGVVLDMLTLTNALKSRYITTQVAIYPIVEKVRAFGTTQQLWLNNLLDQAKIYEENPTDELAIKMGKSFLATSTAWGKIMSSSIKGSKKSVYAMTSQMKDVSNQLETQLQLLQKKLTELKESLKTAKEQLKQWQAAFWGSLAGMLLGVLVMVAGILTVNPFLLAGGGFLFSAGEVAATLTGRKMAEFAGDVKGYEVDISETSNAITELEKINSNYVNIGTAYESLNEFWGRIDNDANMVKTTNDVMKEMGSFLLMDPTTAEANIQTLKTMENACTTYLDVLNSQGITVPDDDDDDAAPLMVKAVPITLEAMPTPLAFQMSPVRYSHSSFKASIAHADNAIKNGDMDTYNYTIALIAIAVDTSTEDGSMSILSNNLDIDSLRKTELFLSPPQLTTTSLAKVAGSDESVLEDASSNLVPIKNNLNGMLTSLEGVGTTLSQWSRDFPKKPDASDTAAVAKVAELQKITQSKVKDARKSSGAAVNMFSDFNNSITSATLGVARDNESTSTDIQTQNVQRQTELGNIRAPFGLDSNSVLQYYRLMMNTINSKYDGIISKLQVQQQYLQQLLKNGNELGAGTVPWMAMVMDTSHSLGRIYNDLEVILNAVNVDPILYEELMNMEWDEVVNNSNQVRALLGIPKTVVLLANKQMKFSKLSAFVQDPTTMYDEFHVFDSVLAPKGLSDAVNKIADTTPKVLKGLDEILLLPYAHGLQGIFDEAGTGEKRSLYDVTSDLREEYIQMAASQYPTIQLLRSTSHLQMARAKNVQAGRITMETFVDVSLGILQTAQQSAYQAQQRSAKSDARFKATLKALNGLITSMDKNLVELDDEIAKTKHFIGAKIASLVADIVALAFTAGALMVTLGFGPVAAAVVWTTQVGLAAGATAAVIEGVVLSMSLADLIDTLSKLKGVRDDIKAARAQLDVVKPVFFDVVTCVSDMSDLLDHTVEMLSDASVRRELGQHCMSDEDVKRIEKTWKDVTDAVTQWLDVMNSQGIEPIYRY